jgi:hypothetical protein
VQRNREFVRIAEKNVQVHLDILDKVKKRAARIGVRSDVDQANGRAALIFIIVIALGFVGALYWAYTASLEEVVCRRRRLARGPFASQAAQERA